MFAIQLFYSTFTVVQVIKCELQSEGTNIATGECDTLPKICFRIEFGHAQVSEHRVVGSGCSRCWFCY